MGFIIARLAAPWKPWFKFRKPVRDGRGDVVFRCRFVYAECRSHFLLGKLPRLDFPFMRQIYKCVNELTHTDMSPPAVPVALFRHENIGLIFLNELLHYRDASFVSVVPRPSGPRSPVNEPACYLQNAKTESPRSGVNAQHP